jgi:hypothetical protein
MRFGHAIRLIGVELQLMYRIASEGVYWNSDLFGLLEYFLQIKSPAVGLGFD